MKLLGGTRAHTSFHSTLDEMKQSFKFSRFLNGFKVSSIRNRVISVSRNLSILGVYG